MVKLRKIVMKIRAEVIPFSSVVGGGVILHDEAGRIMGQLMLMNIDASAPVIDAELIATYRDRYVALCERVAAAINAGQAESQVTHIKKGTTYDVVASKALFQVSNADGDLRIVDARAIQDGDEVTVYRNEHGTFVRFPDEMVLPRFEKVQP